MKRTKISIRKTSLEGVSAIFAKNIIEGEKPMCASWKKLEKQPGMSEYAKPSVPNYLMDRSAIFVAHLILKGLGLEFPIYSIDHIVFTEDDININVEYI
jgi:hypothetical protein